MALNPFNIFGGRSQQTPPTTPPNQPSGTPASADPNAAQNNTTVPNGNTPISDGSHPAFPNNKNASPTDAYANLWTAKDEPITAASTVPNMSFDGAKLLEGARNIDFTKGIDPEIFTKATTGDKAAFAQVISHVGQQSFAQATAMTMGIVDKALKDQATTFETKYAPQLMRRAAIEDAVGSIDLANDPATKPLFDAVTSKVTAAFPNATPTEIKDHVTKYFNGLADKVVGASGGKIQTKAELERTNSDPFRRNAGDGDWGNFFGVDPDTLPG